MANKRIRVCEVARELGLENKEALELCERLRIGVKSHSSSIEDAQADRVRRLADAEGLRRDPRGEEPKEKRGAAATAVVEVPVAPVVEPVADGDGAAPAEAPAPAAPV